LDEKFFREKTKTMLIRRASRKNLNVERKQQIRKTQKIR
jgi:hypothetical protein